MHSGEKIRQALRQSFIPVLIVLIVAIVHLLMIDSYGVSWDEPLHRNWGKMFLLYRQSGDYAFLKEMPGFGMYYGPLYFALNYLLSEFLSAQGMAFAAANHVLNILTFALTAGLVFAFARAVSGRKTAAASVVLFVLFPPFLAHAQYNPKDIPLTLATLAASMAFYRLMRRRTKTDAAIAGAAFGIALAVKISALMLLPVFAVAAAIVLLAGPDGGFSDIPWIKTTALSGIFAAAALLAAFLFWPSLWSHPSILPGAVNLFGLHNYWPGKVLYFGTEYAGHALPWHYTPFSFFMAMPLPVLGLFVAGAVSVVFRIVRKREIVLPALLIALVFVPLAMNLKPGLSRYDGIRQFFFIMPAVCMLAGGALVSVTEWIAVRIRKPAVSVLTMTLIAVAGWLGIQIYQVHPYEGPYVNEAVRLFVPTHFEYLFDIEYWGSPYKEGTEWLNANAKPEAVVCVPVAGLLTDWYPVRGDISFECSARSDYLMFIARSTERKLKEAKLTPVFTVERYDSVLMEIVRLR